MSGRFSPNKRPDGDTGHCLILYGKGIGSQLQWSLPYLWLPLSLRPELADSLVLDRSASWAPFALITNTKFCNSFGPFLSLFQTFAHSLISSLFPYPPPVPNHFFLSHTYLISNLTAILPRLYYHTFKPQVLPPFLQFTDTRTLWVTLFLYSFLPPITPLQLFVVYTPLLVGW